MMMKMVMMMSMMINLQVSEPRDNDDNYDDGGMMKNGQDEVEGM